MNFVRTSLIVTACISFCLLAGTLHAADPKPTDEELKEKAVKLNELTDLEAAQKHLTDLLKDKDTAKRLVKIAGKIQKDADKEKDPPFKFNAALVLAKVSHNVKDYENAELFYEFCVDNAGKLQSGNKMIPAFEGLIDLYWEQKKYNSVEEIAKKFYETEGGKELETAKVFALEKLIQAKAKQGNFDDAMNLVEGLITADKDGFYFVQLKGWIQREAGKLEDAISTYEDVIERIEASKTLDEATKTRLTRNIRYMMTGLHVDNNAIDKAADILKKLIKEDEENPTYYNDLGYIWSDHDKNLDESEKMIRKALELDTKLREKLLKDGKIDADTAKKENAAYLDSLGWVLYKKKDYKEAKKYLEKAIQDDEEGRHIEIWDHLADCLVELGDKKGAIDIWTKCLKFDDVSKRDMERRKVITKKMKKVKDETKE